MVCNHCGSQSHRTNHPKCPNYCTLCKEPGHRQKSNYANSACVASAEPQLTQQPNVRKQDAANAAARPTKAPRASRVLNTSALIAKARSSRKVTTETIALEWKPRYATNAAKQVTARTNARFVRAMHVVFEVTNYKRAICVQNTCALYVTATKNQKITTTIYAHVQSAKRASYSVT